MNFESILNNLLTSGFGIRNSHLVRRIRVLNVLQVALALISPTIGLFYFYIGVPYLFYISVITCLLMIFGIILLRKTRNIIIGGNYTVFVLWAGISTLTWKTGVFTFEGFMNPSWMLSAGLVLLAVFLNGYPSGTVWAGIVFIQTGILMYLFRTGYPFDNLIPSNIALIYYAGTYMVGLLLILLFAFLFEREKNETMHREEEKALAIRKTKRFMDEIFDRYPLPTFVIDKKHRVVQWNQACQEASRIPKEDILGKKVWEGFAVDDRGTVADILLENVDSINEDRSDLIISKTNSGWFETEAILPKFGEGQPVIITAAPISDNNGMVRGAIQAIREVKYFPKEPGIPDYLNKTFPRPVYAIDLRGKITSWNKACEDIFGYTADQMIGKSPLTIVADRYKPLFKAMFSRVLKGESFKKLEWKYNSGKGKPIYVFASAFPSKSIDGEYQECIVDNTDVSDLWLKMTRSSRFAAESNEKLKTLSKDYNLLKKNLATFIRKKEKPEISP